MSRPLNPARRVQLARDHVVRAATALRDAGKTSEWAELTRVFATLDAIHRRMTGRAR